jgi:nicotinamidase-related amidase
MSVGCRHARVPRSVEEIVHPDHSALVVVDVQNDFVHEDGFTGRAGADVGGIQAAVEGVNRVILLSRRAGMPVVYVREIVSRKTVLPNFLTRCGDFDHCPAREGTWGADWYAGLTKPLPDEAIIDKPCYDGFQDSMLDVTLRHLGARTCLYAGFASNVCVEATARHGFVLGYYTVLVTDATAGDSASGHTACLQQWQAYYGPLMTTDSLERVWAAPETIHPHATVPGSVAV